MSDASIDQSNHARRGFMAALAGTPIANRLRGRGTRLVWTDQLAAQPFTKHPVIHDPNEVGISTLAVHHAAQVMPTAWDGESGASAPAITKTV